MSHAAHRDDHPPKAPSSPNQSQQHPPAAPSWTPPAQHRAPSPPLTSPAAGAQTPSPAITPTLTDRVFPVRSVVSVDPTPTPNRFPSDYFHTFSHASDSRRPSQSSTASSTRRSVHHPDAQSDHGVPVSPVDAKHPLLQRQQSGRQRPEGNPRTAAMMFSDIISSRSGESGADTNTSTNPSLTTSLTNGSTSQPSSLVGVPVSPTGHSSLRSNASSRGDQSLVTHRFKHIITKDGHAVITGRGGETLQRCEDEPIHIPGAVQGFGVLIALREESDGNLAVRIVSENSKRIIGRSPRELFALESFTDILSDEQADNLLDHIDFIRDEDADVATNGPEVFTMSVKIPHEKNRKLWCAIHMSERNPGLIICEFELEDDHLFPLVPPEDISPSQPEDTLHNKPSEAELVESTESLSKPLRILRSARKRRGEAAAMGVFNIMSQVQEQLAAAPTLEKFLKVLVGVVKELTGFHRVMIYQFDQSFNGRVVTELVDPRATKDLYHGLKFPASDIPKQARDLYKLNRVRMLYDRDQETARLVCRTAEDIERPLDLSYSYLRAMSPIHLKYLANMAVRSSMSISINAFDELWGLISCHTYGPQGQRVSFPIRKMCRLVGDAASRNIERLSYASRLQARKLINTAPTSASPSGYIVASSDDLLKLFDADFGLLSIHDETKILGRLGQASQEALALLEYLRMRRISAVTTSHDIVADFPDLRYPPGFQTIAGMLIVPLSAGGRDFIVFFRKGQLKEVKWAGNPYEKFIREGTEGYLEPRKSFKIWRETVIGKSREWTEEEVETAAVLCLVYGKFIDVWRQKEAALQSSQLTRLLLANSAHEVRTPLNAIINYLEIALEGSLDQEIRDNLTKSHSASKSLIYVINDLLDLTKTEEGASLIKGDNFDLKATLKEATDMFAGDAKRKNLEYNIIAHEGLPETCIGDQGRVRQAISNIIVNAIQHTTEGGITVEMYVTNWPRPEYCEVEVAVTDTGAGMSADKLDRLFNELEQVQSEQTLFEDPADTQQRQITQKNEKGSLGLGLALVSRIIRNMNGQLRLKSEEGKGSRFVVQFPFELPQSEGTNASTLSNGNSTPQPPETPHGERTLVARTPSRENSISDDQSDRLKRTSVDSLNSRSGKSIHSFKSASSQRSDVDRLIEAIQVPVLEPSKNSSSQSMRPLLTKQNSSQGPEPGSPKLTRSKSLDIPSAHDNVPAHQRSLRGGSVPGEEQLAFSNTAIKPVKIPDDPAPGPVSNPPGGIIGEINEEVEDESAGSSSEAVSPDHMRVLVAEDDPVNSRIIKKRLEKLKHSVTLTVNGEECAAAFGETPREFDVVLMDMQMPIVDGLTSTKMIRSFEKTNSNTLSPRACLCGRVPIFAVSASLVEKDLSMYLDTGFDGWILKPINFSRLSELLTGIVDIDVRKNNMYEQAKTEWERGGWFPSEERAAHVAAATPSTPLDEHPPPTPETTDAKDFAADALSTAEGQA